MKATISILFILMILPITADLSNDSNMITVQAATASFTSQWNTTLISDGSSYSTQIKLPLVNTGTYDFTVDWGDGNFDTITSYDQTEILHNYSSEGVYTLVIDGTLVGWQFDNGGDKLKIIEISQWGNMGLGNTGHYFYGCENLVLSATDAPDLTGTTTLYRAFRGCYSLGSTGSMDTWDVSSVTNMTWMFTGASSFNQPIGNWDVSSIHSMYAMFYHADSFNQPIDGWDVSRVTNMEAMFMYSSSFNQDISSWDVSSVTIMRGMFASTSFNQDISSWDVSSVTSMSYMFEGAYFNQNIGDWDVSSVTYMEGMLSFANLSIANYDSLLIGWAELPLQYGVNFDAGYSLYSDNSAASRQKIIDTFAWTIVDGGHTELPSSEITITTNTNSDAISSSENNTTEVGFLNILQLNTLWPLLVIVVIRIGIKKNKYLVRL